jgi:hypothetical protein
MSQDDSLMTKTHTSSMNMLNDSRSTGRLGTLLSVVLAAMLVLLAVGCQDPVEPDAVTSPISVTIQLAGENGAPINGADVEFGKPGNLNAIGATTGGQVKLSDFPVRIQGDTFIVRITPPPPPSNATYVAARRVTPSSLVKLNTSPITDTLFVGCQDIRIAYRISDSIPPVPCNGSRSDTLAFTFCLEDRTSDTLCTSLLSHACAGQTLSFTLPSSGVAGLTLEARDSRNVLLGNPFTRTTGESFKICAVYETTTPTTVDVPPITIVGTSPTGGSFTEQMSISIAVANCTTCRCPQEDLRVDRTAIDTVCIDNPESISLDLGSIVNSGDPECVWEFERLNGFTSPDIRIDRDPSSLSGGGNRLGAMQIRFAPTRRALYTDSAIYQLRIRNTRTGEVSQCKRLIVIFRGYGGQGVCNIDMAGSSFFRFNATTNRYEADTLFQCVSTSGEAKSLCIQNTGECDLTIDASILIDPNLFSVSPSRLVIPRGKRQCFSLSFLPDLNDVYPIGRNNPPRLDFSDSLRLTGCTPQSFPLIGRARPTCAKPSNFIAPQYGQKDSSGTTWQIVIGINNDNSLSVGPNPSGSTDSVAVFVQSITTGGPPPNGAVTGARLSTGKVGTSCYAQFKLVDNRNPLPQPICALFNIYSGNIPVDATWVCDVDIKLGDILLFERNGFYGIMWVKKLSYREQNNVSIPQVEIDVCYPFN